ncbi:unnamed protein product [Eretmochelys imbricata]
MRVQRPAWTGHSIIFRLLVPLGIPHSQRARMVTSLPVWRRGHITKIKVIAYSEVAGKALYPSECCTHFNKEILCICPYYVLTNLSRFEVAVTEKLMHMELVQINCTYWCVIAQNHSIELNGKPCPSTHPSVCMMVLQRATLIVDGMWLHRTLPMMGNLTWDLEWHYDRMYLLVNWESCSLIPLDSKN